MRTWPVWKAPWTVPLYAADVCSPAKKSLPPTLPPKAAVMVFFDVPAMIERLGAAQGKVGEWHCQRRQRWVGRRTDCNICVRALRKRIGAPSRANHLRRSRRDRDRPREDLDQIRPDLRWRCRGDAWEIVSRFVRNYAQARDAQEVCWRSEGERTCVQTAALLIPSAVSADAPSANVMSTGLVDNACTLRK